MKVMRRVISKQLSSYFYAMQVTIMPPRKRARTSATTSPSPKVTASTNATAPATKRVAFSKSVQSRDRTVSPEANNATHVRLVLSDFLDKTVNDIFDEQGKDAPRTRSTDTIALFRKHRSSVNPREYVDDDATMMANNNQVEALMNVTYQYQSVQRELQILTRDFRMNEEESEQMLELITVLSKRRIPIKTIITDLSTIPHIDLFIILLMRLGLKMFLKIRHQCRSACDETNAVECMELRNAVEERITKEGVRAFGLLLRSASMGRCTFNVLL